jgi:hypothetical protein
MNYLLLKAQRLAVTNTEFAAFQASKFRLLQIDQWYNRRTLTVSLNVGQAGEH